MPRPIAGEGGWRGLAFWAAIATTIAIVVTAYVAQILLLLISAALLAIGAALMRRRGNAGPILLGIVALLFLLTDGPFLIPYLRVPTSWTNFILACPHVHDRSAKRQSEHPGKLYGTSQVLSNPRQIPLPLHAPFRHERRPYGALARFAKEPVTVGWSVCK